MDWYTIELFVGILLRYHLHKLCSLFKVSDSTNYDFEMLKKPFETLFWTVIDEKAVIDETEKYSSSIFGQIEERLARKSVVQLNPA